MTEPLKIRIQKAMTASLESISPAGGFNSDLAGKVFRGRLLFDNDDPVPMLSILEAPVPLDKLAPPKGSPKDSGEWELLIQGFADDDRENPTDPAHLLMADVKRVLVRERALLGGEFVTVGPFGMGNAISSLSIGQGVVRPPEEHISAKAYFWLGVKLRIVENLASS